NIDINVHPTKQEIKFDDERLVYNYLKVTVRHALGAHNITPTLDFDQEPAFQATPSKVPVIRPEAAEPQRVSDHRPSRPTTPETNTRHQDNLRNWQRLYEGMGIPIKGMMEPEEVTNPFEPPVIAPQASVEVLEMDDEKERFTKIQKDPYQIHGQYIVNHIKSGFVLIDQQAASERILYERYQEALNNQPIATQKMLFPKTLEFPPADAALLREIVQEVNTLGFEIAEFGGNTFVVHGIPANLGGHVHEEVLLEKVLEQYKNNFQMELSTGDKLARAMARNASLSKGQVLSVPEMRELIDQLFACAMPFSCPSGKKCFVQYDLDDVRKWFET
ncbi:MAG: DNA mismatch repair protein MutL, partial [Saprospiraceae bacterium]|nr:DNA mismatch repair protein MutL [Saprospiraceae bacterium]